MVFFLKHHSFLIFVVLQLYYHIPKTEFLDITKIIADVGDSVTMTCNNSRSANRRWKKEGEIIFENLDDICSDGTMFLSNDTYALKIKQVGVKHEGMYTCQVNNMERNVTILLVRAQPVIIIKFGQEEKSNFTSDPVLVNINKRFTAECYVHARSAINLTWTINGERVEASSTNTGNMTSLKYLRTTSLLNTTIKEHQGQITCINSGRINVSLDDINATISYESPELTLVFKEFQEVNNSLHIELGKVVTAICSSSVGSSRTTLSWLVNGISYNAQVKKCKESNQTDEITSCIQYLPESSHHSITCVAQLGNSSVELAKVKRRLHVYGCPRMIMTINGEETDKDVLIDRNGYTVAKCQIQGTSKKFNLSWNYEHSQLQVVKQLEGEDDNSIILHFQPLRSRVSIECVYRRNNTCQIWGNATSAAATGLLETILQSSIFYPVLITAVGIIVIMLIMIIRFKLKGPNNKTSTNTYSLHHQPIASRELPSIHVNDTIVENVSNTFQEKFPAINNDYDTGTVSRCDVQLSCQLPGEGTMKYWLAVTTSGSNEETKIIAKTLSEDARMKEVMNFRSLAENLMSLKKHESLVEVLGVALDNVPYYIYQEYISCGTLKDYLLRNYQHSHGSAESETSPSHNDNKTIQLTALTVDICEGMLFLANQRYRHPAVTTRKVLLSSTGRCKLYDFWPAALAQDRMKSILELKVPPLAWLAPECVFLHQYLEKSDVWNFGVVAWEVYSLGDTPFGGLTCSEIESKLRGKEDLSQPLACPGGLFGELLSTWNSSAEERPSFGDLQRKLTHFLTDMEQSFEEVHKKEELPNYFTLSKDEDLDYDDYIES